MRPSPPDSRSQQDRCPQWYHLAGSGKRPSGCSSSLLSSCLWVPPAPLSDSTCLLGKAGESWSLCKNKFKDFSLCCDTVSFVPDIFITQINTYTSTSIKINILQKVTNTQTHAFSITNTHSSTKTHLHTIKTHKDTSTYSYNNVLMI